MKNVTLSVPEHVLQLARKYAKDRGTTLNAMIREFLAKTVVKEQSTFEEEIDELRKAVQVDTTQKMSRDDIYER